MQMGTLEVGRGLSVIMNMDIHTGIFGGPGQVEIGTMVKCCKFCISRC